MKTLIRAFIPLAFTVIAAGPAHAATSTVYGDLAAWTAAVVGPVSLQTFQDRSAYPDGWPMSGREFLPGVNVTTNMQRLIIVRNIADESRLFGIERDNIDPYYDVNYTLPYQAVAFDVDDFEAYPVRGGAAQPADIQVFFADDTSLVVQMTGNEGTPIFFGVTSDTAITRIRFNEPPEQEVVSAHEEVTLDNFRLAQVASTAVPEPSTYMMLLAGLGLLGAVARRRMV